MVARYYTLIFINLIGVATLSARIIHVTDEKNYKSIIEAHNKPTLVEFAAEWCSVCTGIQKHMEEVADDPEFSHVAFIQVDVDKCDGLCKERGVVGVPTFVYMQEGKEKIKETGVQKVENFSDHIRATLRESFKFAQNAPQANTITDQQPQPVVEEEQVMVQETVVPVEEPSFIARIMAFISIIVTAIVTTIKNAVMSLIDTIKGFFNS